MKGRTEYQAETISKQNVELKLFLTADSKIQTKRLDLKMRLLSHKEAEFKIRKILNHWGCGQVAEKEVSMDLIGSRVLLSKTMKNHPQKEFREN